MAKVLADVFDEKGKIKSIELPAYFALPYREDIINKVYRVLQLNARHPYGAYVLAGEDRSASSKVRHGRGQYMAVRGRGMSRVPRKIMSRRKPQGFYWQGAIIPGARGGRQAHPPKPIKKELRVNKKEKFLAFLYALSATANKEVVANRYAKLEAREKLPNLPIVFDIPDISQKLKKAKEIKQIISSLKPYFDGLLFKEKKIRAGKGKARGRRYKSSAGLLLITANSEVAKVKTAAIDIVSADRLGIKHLAPGNQPGRLTAFTFAGLKQLDERIKQQAERLGINLNNLVGLKAKV
jgi:large subunit ribosomal protein L4e